MAAVLIILGSVLVSVGAGLVYLPAGLIVGGLLALGFGVDATRDVLPMPARKEGTVEARLRAVGDDS